MTPDWTQLGVSTLLSHFAEEDRPHGAVVTPIYQNSLFQFEHMADLHQAMAGHLQGPPFVYSRVANPNMDVAERKIAQLHGAEAAKVLGSGMGAISSAIVNNLESGAHVVVVDTCYFPVRQLLDEMMSKFGVSVTYVDGRSTDAVIDAFRPETKMLYLEAPTSLLFRMQDVAALTKVAKERGILTIFDNTYNSPLNFRPHEHGVDLVCESCSKYLNGHSDITAGAVTGTRELIDRIATQEINLLGSALHPFSSWLLVRGMRTLSVRMPVHEATANTVAGWLESQPEVERVHHLGLESYPQRNLVTSQLDRTGGLFSFEPKTQNVDRILAFVDRLHLFGRGVSWGGYESLVVTLPIKTLEDPAGTWVVRLFCGLEEPKDLIADIEQALPALRGEE